MQTTEERVAVQLTPRELQVLRLAADGLTEIETARSLGLSRFTAKQYRAQAREKLGARNMTDAVIQAIKAGVLVLSDDSPG